MVHSVMRARAYTETYSAHCRWTRFETVFRQYGFSVLRARMFACRFHSPFRAPRCWQSAPAGARRRASCCRCPSRLGARASTSLANTAQELLFESEPLGDRHYVGWCSIAQLQNKSAALQVPRCRHPHSNLIRVMSQWPPARALYRPTPQQPFVGVVQAIVGRLATRGASGCAGSTSIGWDAW